MTASKKSRPENARAHTRKRTPVEASAEDDEDNMPGAEAWKKGWRSVFLLLVTALCAFGGLRFHSYSESGQEPAVLQKTRQTISVYSSAPDVTVHLTVNTTVPIQLFVPTVRSNIQTTTDNVYLTVSGPDAKPSTLLMIRSSLFPATINPDCYYRHVAIQGGSEGAPDAPSAYFCITSLSNLDKFVANSPYGALPKVHLICQR